MASWTVRTQRALVAAPFLLITAWCFHYMDLETLIAFQEPFAESGVIEWEGGKFTIIKRFYNVDFFDDTWRGSMATFSTSTFGYDALASWQMFSFLIDLGPVYAIWILESYRSGIAYTPMYFPTIFTFLGQFLGLGSVAPIFYFLLFAFGPTASALARSSVQNRTVWNQGRGALLPVIFLFHTAEVFAMCLAPELATRHYWTWAWQLTPLWIGIGNILLTRLTKSLLPKSTIFTSPKLLLVVMGTMSAGAWIYTLIYSPYPLSTIFIPVLDEQVEFIPFVRRVFQVDHVSVFSSSFLWLLYSFVDLGKAGLLEKGWLYNVALLLVLTLSAGPGAAFTFGWYIRERALASAKGRPAVGSKDT
ncbi:hypothetical protein GGS26DRAFT_546167 [Hypomontagnella submonticulosa]|nr:hypothetical protein GGS26DRAFT_546167 [Hypomontagnella submonticulosa]